MIEAKNLKKVYKTKKGVVVNALDGVSVKLPSTGMVFILGKSGSGKSTLLNVLGGLDSFDSGEIIIKGTSAKDFKQSHYDSYRNTYIGFIFQEYNVLEELTVGANVALAIELQGRKATDDEVNAILKEVDLDGFGARKPNELSGGQKQRVAIARALVKKPEIIMADEPTGALDSATGRQVFDTLKKLSRDKLVLIVSHDREFSEQYADRIIELKDGVIISDVEKSSSDYVVESSNEEDDSLTFEEGEIKIKRGYTLTEADRLAINKYLTQLATGATIKVDDVKRSKKASSANFKPTDESKIQMHKSSDFKLIKSKLSVKNAFKLGSGGLKHKKFRLVFTIFLSLIAFTLFGLADTIAAYDSVQTTTNSIYDTGVNYASYVKMVKRTSGDYEYWITDSTYLTPDDIKTISEQTGRDIVGVYKKDVNFSYSGNIGKNEVDGMKPSVIYTDYLSGIAAIDQSLLSSHGFTLLGNSRLPEAGKNEIVITKYAYDYFNKVGYVTYTDKGEEKFDITSENDLIGKTLSLDMNYKDSNSFTIVGIVDTKFDYSRYEKLAADDAEYTVSMIEQMSLTSELEAAQQYSFACVGFVNPQIISDILASKEGMPERLNNANLTLYSLVDDSLVDEGYIYGEDGKSENVLSTSWYDSINTLSNVKGNVVWINSPLESLADNQIIVTNSQFSSFVSGGVNSYPEVYHNQEKLVGFEKQMLDNQGDWGMNYHVSLQSIFDSPRYFASIKYAHENTAQAKAFLMSKYGWGESDIEDNFTYGRFAEQSYQSDNDDFNKLVTEAYVKSYIDEVIARYSLSSYKVADSFKEQLIVSFVNPYDSKEYKSYDPNSITLKMQLNGRINDIIARKYAAENFEDACRYYMLAMDYENADSMQHVQVDYILSTYASYLLYGNNDSNAKDFTPVATVDFDTYSMNMLVNVYKSNQDSAKKVFNVNSYMTGASEYIKNIEIVGVIPDYEETNSYMSSCAVVSDNLVNKLFGANRGGIYSYAVGIMPTEKSGVNEIVKFSKTYINDAGDVKYQLSNNVTSQLSMVDELLGVLGQVFMYVGLGFALFASLMLTNFIGTSISYKKQEIGILRAIGSRSGDVFRIFFAESFIIAMINYVLSLAGTLSLTIVINNVLRNDAGLLITFLSFGIRQIGVLLAVSLAVAFIATFFPVKKIASMKPIDAIKNRK